MVFTITVHLYVNSDPASIDKLKAKLIDCARVYVKDKETISWFVMQNTKDPRSFTIIERYENEGSLKIHMDNPYFQTFAPYVTPLLEKPMDVMMHEELDTSKEVVVPE